MSNPVPGWYPKDGLMAHWNGIEWTGETRPLMAGEAPQPLAQQQETGGMTLAVFGYILAVIVPFIGLILGIVAVTRGPGHASKKHGPWIIVLSAIAAVIYVLLVISGQHAAATCSMDQYGNCI